MNNRESGYPVVPSFVGATLSTRTLLPSGNTSMHLSGDGSLVIADSAAGGYNLSFSAKNWALIDLGHKMVAPYSQHRIAPDRNILVNVRDEKGNGVSRAVNVSDIGTVAVL